MNKNQKMSEADVHRLGSVAAKTATLIVFTLLAVLVGAVLQKIVFLNQNYALRSVSNTGFAERRGQLDLRYTSGEITNVDVENGMLTVKPNGSDRTFAIDSATKFVQWDDSSTNASAEQNGTTSTASTLPQPPYQVSSMSVSALQEGMQVGVYTDSSLLDSQDSNDDTPRAILVATLVSDGQQQDSEDENMSQEEQTQQNETENNGSSSNNGDTSNNGRSSNDGSTTDSSDSTPEEENTNESNDQGTTSGESTVEGEVSY
jgi:hypothetical protein